jgi:hypothetical protein
MPPEEEDTTRDNEETTTDKSTPSRGRRIAFHAALVVAVLVLAIVCLPLYSPLFRGLVAGKLQAATGQKVDLDGFSCNLLLSNARLRSLAIREEDGRGDLFVVKNLDLDFSLWPLLWGRVRVPRLSVRGVEANLVIDQTGRANYESILQQLARRDNKGRAPEPSLPDVAGRIELENASVNYRNDRTGVSSQLVEGSLSGRINGLDDITYTSRCRQITVKSGPGSQPAGQFRYELNGELAVYLRRDAPYVESEGLLSVIQGDLQDISGQSLSDLSFALEHRFGVDLNTGIVDLEELRLNSDYLDVSAAHTRITEMEKAGRLIGAHPENIAVAALKMANAIGWSGQLRVSVDPTRVGKDFGPIVAAVSGGMVAPGPRGGGLVFTPQPASLPGDLSLQLEELELSLVGDGARKTVRAGSFISLVPENGPALPIGLLCQGTVEGGAASGLNLWGRFTDGPLRGINVDGRIGVARSADVPTMHLRVRMPRSELSPDLLRFVPVKLPEFLHELDIDGALMGEATVDVAADGRLSYSVRLDTFGVNCLSASLPISLRGFSASLYADEKRLQCRSFVGRSWGGLAEGNAVLHFARPDQPDVFDVYLRVQGADLERIFAGLGPNDSKLRQISGRTDLKVDAAGDLADHRSITGRGHLNIREGRLAKLPLLAGFLGVLKLNLPDRGIFDTVEIDFRLSEGQILLPRLLLSSEVVDITGKGSIAFNGDTRLVLAAATSTRTGKGIPLLSKAVGTLVRGIQQHILPPVLVTGKAWDPRYKVMALEPIKKPLRSLKGLIPLLPSPKSPESDL